MNQSDMIVASLAQEVRVLLGVSSVGLYEFVWLLRRLAPESSEVQRRAYASAALGQLIDEGAARLVLLGWPSEQVLGERSVTDIGADAWGDPVNGVPYLALMPA